MIDRLFKGVMGEVDSSPFVPRSKMNPLVAAAGIAGGASILSNLLGLGASSSANQANIEMQRETNAQNYKIFKENLAWQEDMWNKQNEYNLPSNVVERLKAAGINPSAVYGNGSATPAGSVGSVGSPQMQAARVNPYQFDLNGVGQAVNAYYQNQYVNALRNKTNAETHQVEQDTLFARESMADRLKHLSEIAKGEGWRADLARTELQYQQESLYWREKQLRNEVSMQGQQMQINQETLYNHRLQNGLAEVQLAYAPKLNEAQLKQYYTTVAQLKAQIGLINANTMLTDEQRKHEIEKKCGTIIDNGLKGLDFKLKDATKKYVIQDASNHAAMLDFNRRNQKTLTRVGMLSSVIPLTNGFKIP